MKKQKSNVRLAIIDGEDVLRHFIPTEIDIIIDALEDFGTTDGEESIMANEISEELCGLFHNKN